MLAIKIKIQQKLISKYGNASDSDLPVLLFLLCRATSFLTEYPEKSSVRYFVHKDLIFFSALVLAVLRTIYDDEDFYLYNLKFFFHPISAPSIKNSFNLNL